MPQVTINVGGRSYLVACEDGQEERLLDLAAYMEEKVQALVRSTRQAADQRLLVMAALLIADELFDCRDGKSSDDDLTSEAGAQRTAMLEDRAAAALEACARRIDALAARVEDA